MNPGNVKKPPIKPSRIHRLLKLVNLLQSGLAQTTRTLATECGVSRRTVFRDLELLRQSDVGIEFDEQAQSFVMRGTRSLPATNFTAAESLAVLALCHHMGNHKGLPFLEHASTAALKIESSLPSRLREELATDLRSLEIMVSQFNPLTDMSTTFDVVRQATGRRRNLRIRYFDATKRKEIQTKLSPYRIFFLRRSWYVIGRSSLHRSPRTFNLGRILEVTLLDGSFRVPRGFSIKRHLGNAWQMVPAPGPDHRIKARFSAKVALNVAEVHWHATQKTRWRADGSLDFEVKVSGIDEISWWLLSYGDQVEVLAPKSLRDLVSRRLEDAAKQYRQPKSTTSSNKENHKKTAIKHGEPKPKPGQALKRRTAGKKKAKSKLPVCKNPQRKNKTTDHFSDRQG
ncbi:MAG: WYL domain-containing protein [Pirellulales bacterium]|nr:WYL domain-containing protein [Pirellulales bacterium]